MTWFFVRTWFHCAGSLKSSPSAIKKPIIFKGRKSLSAAEELETRRIAKARIHVERFNERLKQFQLVSRRIPLSLAPVATQMVVVAACLVNF